MEIGYACLTIGVPGTALKTCTLKYADEQNLERIIENNLHVLERMIDYNIEQGIRLFRISSDIIPFGSNPVNKLEWNKMFQSQLEQIGEKAMQAGMRLSMHPGQYTVLNSPRADVVDNAIKDLEYHNLFLDSLGLDSSHKLILHIGGVYNDKKAAMEKFADNYQQLSDGIKKRLIIENDDRSYNIQEVFSIGEKVGIPVVFDVLHHQVLPSQEERTVREWIEKCGELWTAKDGRPKIHYSQQEPDKKPGSHSHTIKIDEFMEFYDSVNGLDIDIMLEVKDKNVSAVKCGLCTARSRKIKYLEQEWGRYKYMILEKSPALYKDIRLLLKDKKSYPAIGFYEKVETAMCLESQTGNSINAFQHVWGYFKDAADEKEKKRFEKNMIEFREGRKTSAAVKKYLGKLAEKYQREYLLNSYYFDF